MVWLILGFRGNAVATLQNRHEQKRKGIQRNIMLVFYMTRILLTLYLCKVTCFYAILVRCLHANICILQGLGKDCFPTIRLLKQTELIQIFDTGRYISFIDL